jgi:hypothetical protein
LEAEIDATFFSRTTRAFTLTDAGATYLMRAFWRIVEVTHQCDIYFAL